MRQLYQRAFEVRHYECDAYGHVNHANYLRYMQETALNASAEVGYDIEWYEKRGRAWIIRETDITYLRPLRYGDVVLVQTWVDHFSRVRSRRAYRLLNKASGEPVAEAHTDWVYMNLTEEYPERVPAEMAAAFGARQEEEQREPFPVAPPAPPGVFTMHQQVAWRDVDQQRHVNNAKYLSYLEECSMQVGAAHGWPAERMMDEGFAIVARRYRIQYKQPARIGDTLAVSTWASDVRRATAVRHYRVTRTADSKLLARAHVLWVWVSLQDGRPMRIPGQFRADFAPNVVEPAGSV